MDTDNHLCIGDYVVMDFDPELVIIVSGLCEIQPYAKDEVYAFIDQYGETQYAEKDVKTWVTVNPFTRTQN